MNCKEEVLIRQLNALEHQDMLTLTQKFEELHGFKPGNTTPRNLRKRLAYRLQEIYLGGVSEADANLLSSIADKDPLAQLRPSSVKKIIGQAGTRFKRLWKGVEYEVISAGDGIFEFNGKKYKSLSAIAREITGTRWNGKIFFGVK